MKYLIVPALLAIPLAYQANQQHPTPHYQPEGFTIIEQGPYSVAERAAHFRAAGEFLARAVEREAEIVERDGKRLWAFLEPTTTQLALLPEIQHALDLIRAGSTGSGPVTILPPSE